MPIETIGNFSVRKITVIDEKGNVDESLMPDISNKDMDMLYRYMRLSRMFDEKCIKLQRQGRLGTYAPCTGQEASAIGSAFVLRKTDWIFPAYRENAALFYHGFPLKTMILYWMGHEAGNLIPDDTHTYMMCLPISTHLPLAIGFSYGCKLKEKDTITMVYFGDGATSEGDFHEAMNFAGVFKLPVIFVCQNNGWAISTPVSKQTASQSIAQKAIAYGFEGIQVDGNDVFSVIYAAKIAVKNACNSMPTLIECITYRISPHTTADDPTKYSQTEDIEIWKKRDPILRLMGYMRKIGLWNEEYERDVAKECEEKINNALEEAEGYKENHEEIFRHVYSDIPWFLQEEMRKSGAINKRD